MNSRQDISGLITDLRSSHDYQVRIDAATALAKTGDFRAVEPLIEALTDRDDDVRVSVLKALAVFEDDAVVSRVVAMLSDPEPKVRIETMKTLLALKAGEAIPEICLRLKDPDWAVRNWAIKTLNGFIENVVALSDMRNVPIIIELLKTDEPTLRHHIEEALIAEKETYLPELIEVIERGTSQQKKSICYILGKSGNERVVFPLINIINDWDKEVRSAVIRALGELRDERALSPLIRSLGDVNVDVRKDAVRALTRFREHAVLPLIRALIMSRDCYIRQNAAIALGEIGDKRAISALLVSLGDSYFLVRTAVESALEKFGPQIAPRLIELLTISDDDTELAVQLIDSPLANETLKGIEILSIIDNPYSVKLLQRLLHDPFPRVQEAAQRVLFSLGCYAWARTGAARLLGSLRIMESIPTLIKALDDPDKDVRIEAIRSLGFLRANEAIPLLIGRLRDQIVYIRSVSAWALGRIGSAEAVPALLEMLSDPDFEVRLLTISALGKLRDPRAVLPLLKVIRQSAFRLKEAATNAIKTIGKPAIPVIIEGLGSGDPEITEAIDEVLQLMKDDFTDQMIDEIVPKLSENQKKHFLDVIGRRR